VADAPHARAPGGWEPLAHGVWLRFTASDLNAVDAFAASLGVSRSWFLRCAIALGAPGVVADVRAARRAGVAPGTGRPGAGGALGVSGDDGAPPSIVAWAPAARRPPRARRVDLLDD